MSTFLGILLCCMGVCMGGACVLDQASVTLPDAVKGLRVERAMGARGMVTLDQLIPR